MKILRLIPPLLLSLILVGCNGPDEDFCNKKIVILEKNQSLFYKEKNQAEYRISFENIKDPPMRRCKVYVLPVDFGNPGDIIIFENGKMTTKKER